MRFLFAVAAALNLNIIGGDLSQAFTNADLPENEQYYMWPPAGAPQNDEHGNQVVWKIVKSLYGGKNAGRNWYLLLREVLKTLGFKPCDCEPCVFVRKTEKGLMIIGIYVDDMITLYSNKEEKDEVYA